MMPSWCQGICRTLNMDSTFAGMPATPFKMWVDQVGCDGGLRRRCPAPGTQARQRRVAWSGSRVMLAGRPPAGEQGDDDRHQVPGAGTAGQTGGLLNVGLGVGEQQPDIVIGSLFTLCRVGQRGEQRVLGGHDACLHFGDSLAMPEGMTWCAPRVSRRTMSTLSSCAHRLLPSTRACLA